MAFPPRCQPEQFKCGCGKCGLGFNDMNPATIKRLDEAMLIAGIPFNITSSISCFDAYLSSYSVDISCDSDSERYLILYGLLSAGFDRLGIYRRHIYVDDHPQSRSRVVWYES